MQTTNAEEFRTCSYQRHDSTVLYSSMVVSNNMLSGMFPHLSSRLITDRPEKKTVVTTAIGAIWNGRDPLDQ